MILISYAYSEVIYTVNIGGNAQENWDLVSESEEDDLWFHLGDDRPSSHVVLKISDEIKSKKLPPAIIYKCCTLCKQYSKFKTFQNIPIIYTKIKNITKGDNMGSVHEKKTKSIKV